MSVARPIAAGRSGSIRFDSTDVSTGGAFLRTDILFEVGELLVLEFQLPRAGGDGPHVAPRGACRAFRAGGRRMVPGMGVEFVDLRPEDRRPSRNACDR